MSDTPLMLTPRQVERIARAVRWVEQHAPGYGGGSMAGAMAGALPLPDSLLRLVGSTPDGDGHYDAVVTVLDPATGSYTDGDAVKVKDANGTELASGDHVMARPAGYTTGGDFLYVCGERSAFAELTLSGVNTYDAVSVPTDILLVPDSDPENVSPLVGLLPFVGGYVGVRTTDGTHVDVPSELRAYGQGIVIGVPSPGAPLTECASLNGQQGTWWLNPDPVTYPDNTVEFTATSGNTTGVSLNAPSGGAVAVQIVIGGSTYTGQTGAYAGLQFRCGLLVGGSFTGGNVDGGTW